MNRASGLKIAATAWVVSCLALIAVSLVGTQHYLLPAIRQYTCISFPGAEWLGLAWPLYTWWGSLLGVGLLGVTLLPTRLGMSRRALTWGYACAGLWALLVSVYLIVYLTVPWAVMNSQASTVVQVIGGSCGLLALPMTVLVCGLWLYCCVTVATSRRSGSVREELLLATIVTSAPAAGIVWLSARWATLSSFDGDLPFLAVPAPVAVGVTAAAVCFLAVIGLRMRQPRREVSRSLSAGVGSPLG